MTDSDRVLFARAGRVREGAAATWGAQSNIYETRQQLPQRRYGLPMPFERKHGDSSNGVASQGARSMALLPW